MHVYTISRAQIAALEEIRDRLGNFMIPDRRARNMGYDELGELLEVLISQELAPMPVVSVKTKTSEKQQAAPAS